ncbi:MAG: ATP-dependent DNA helicase [Oceanospirillaceae bacterium]|nr:ATP-dependent DNA helicase [Oceanospirillaceae bacterium]
MSSRGRRISIRSLCEFTARRGDIDQCYTPAPTAAEGIEGHQRLQRKRPASYTAEYALEFELDSLLLRGRADGLDISKRLVEEIKTHRGDLERQSAGQRHLHWAQLRAYAAIICQQQQWESVNLRLTYLEVASDEVTELNETAQATTLINELQEQARIYRDWHQHLSTARIERDNALSNLNFPYAEFRKGQRDLAESVYKAAKTERQLLLEAPTGSGKTLGTLFPALRALANSNVDKLFYLTTRNTARRVGLEGIEQLREANEVPLRVVELCSKESGCIEPEKLCQGDSCPLAQGFFDRLPAARAEAFQLSKINLDVDGLRSVASKYKLCPYFFGQEMARWADIVVADINQYLAPTALLSAYLQQDEWRAIALVDESHNLVSRCRDLYSVELAQAQFRFDTNRVKLKKALDGVHRGWQEACKGLGAETVFNESPPEKLEYALQSLCSELSEVLAEQPDQLELQQMLFSASAYLKLAEVFGDHSVIRRSKPRHGNGEVAILNLDPSIFLTQRWADLVSVTLFSATLKPFDYYQQLLGLTSECASGSLPSPFLPDQLRVKLCSHIDTRYQVRDRSVAPIANLLIEQFQRQPGNYLFFASSFSYLQQIASAVEQRAPEISLHLQVSGMRQEERQAYVDSFTPSSQLLGMAVLGGLFSEGVDLKGDRLIGVTVATLGLPPFDDLHQLMRHRFNERFGLGYEYTYLYPGIQKVVQAAGRLIRTHEDRGELLLIDPRFARPEIRALLPSWWPPAEII